MKFRDKLILLLTIIFIVSNLLIFVNRNNGFEYKKFSKSSELYPNIPGNKYVNKWINYKNRFNSDELDEGLALLIKTIRIDTIQDEKNKIINIATWLYNSFYTQEGKPDTSLIGLSPLRQYNYLLVHKEAKLWCGNFQAMVGFFCDAAKLPNRYIEIAPLKNNDDTHEVNEVYIKKNKKWVMIDVTRNIIMVGKKDAYFSAAEYFDHQLKNSGDELFFIKARTASLHTAYIFLGKNVQDKYFNSGHFLRFYYTMNLSKVYAFGPRIKRYFLVDPWYEIYSPQVHHSNYLFRMRQFFFWGLGAIMLVTLLFVHKKKST